MRRDKGLTLQESRVVEIINSPYSQMEPPSLYFKNQELLR